MILRKTREHIGEVVAQPAKNSMLFAIFALCVSLVALMLAGIAVNR